MQQFREFNGKIVRRTIKVGDQVAIVLKNPEKGQPGEHLLVSLDEYRAGLKTYRPSKVALAQE